MNASREQQHRKHMNTSRERQQKSMLIGLIVLAAVLLLSIIGNIVYMSRSGRLSDEKDKLITEKEVLQNEKTVLNETVEIKDGIIEEHKEMIEIQAEEHAGIVQEKDARIAQLSRRAAANANDLKEQQETNKKLRAEKEELMGKYEMLTGEFEKTRQELDALASTHEQLQEQAKIAEQLKVNNLCILNKWERWLCADRYNVSQARRVDHSYIHFEVDGTVFTQAGTKDIHLLIYNPAGGLMYASSEMFAINETGEESPYSIKSQIEYAHEPVHVEFNILHPERLQAGIYNIEVYIDGILSRPSEMILE